VTTDSATDDRVAADEAVPSKREQRRARAAERRARAEERGSTEDRGSAVSGGERGGPRFPVVPVLTVLLVLLLAGVGFLWFTRPATSSIRTSDYVGALEAARSGVVDLTSFDYLTLDDDLRQIKQVTTGDLQKESIDQLNQRRKDITDSQAVVNTKVVGAGVTRATPDSATVVLVIESTTKTKSSTQAQVVRYRIEVQLKNVNSRWLLSGITGR
jgi:Mce-associated membrane protein